jgi:hypothetical protein
MHIDSDEFLAGEATPDGRYVCEGCLTGAEEQAIADDTAALEGAHDSAGLGIQSPSRPWMRASTKCGRSWRRSCMSTRTPKDDDGTGQSFLPLAYGRVVSRPTIVAVRNIERKSIMLLKREDAEEIADLLGERLETFADAVEEVVAVVKVGNGSRG